MIEIITSILKALPWLIPVLLLLVILKMGYVKAPPDEAYIISGLRKKVVIGKAAIRIPFLERVDKVSLGVMTVDVKTGEFVPTNDFINVMVDAVVKIQISHEEELIELAAKNFLNKDNSYIIASVKDVLEGNLREIIGQLTLPSMVQDRKTFGEKVQNNAVPDLRKMGLEVVAFNIQSFRDENGVIENLGIDNISKIRKDASIARANADKEVAIAEAEAKKLARDKEITAEQIIAEKQNELDIRKSELKEEADKRKAQAEMSYAIQEEISRKNKEEMKAEADLVREQRSIEIQKATLDAQEKQKADADLYKRQKEAEAKLYEEQKQAEAIKVKAQNEAEAIRLRGQAEAESIKLKGLAEAEAIDKKAEAMKKYGDAAILEMYFGILPEVAKNIASPLNNVESIKMYGEGNTSRLVGDITKSLTQVTDGLNDGLGLDMKSIILGALGTKALSGKTEDTESNQKKPSVEEVNMVKEYLNKTSFPEAILPDILEKSEEE